MGRGVKERRLMLLGDSGTGKTSLLRSADCVPPAPDLPAVYFKFLERPPGKRKVLLSLWDAPGNEPVPARDAVFPRLDAAIIVFSLDDPDTLENAKRNWYPQVRSKCGKKIPIILVGNKRDLRDDGSEHGISYEQGLKVAEKIRAYAYVECSNLDEHGPLDAFKFAVKAVVKTSSSCSLM